MSSSYFLASQRTAELIHDAITNRDFEHADRLLTEVVSRILLAPEGEQVPESASAQPESTGDRRYDTLLATALGYALEQRNLPIPEWILRVPALETEWLWDGDSLASEEFRDYIRRATPAQFRAKNILLRDRDLRAP